MPDLSVLIPNRNSPFLTPTIKDLLAKSEREIEVIINVDEKWPQEIVDDKRVIYIHRGAPIGMRQGINSCAAIARGKYIMKIDDHCLVGQGFDRILIENHQDNWVQIPRRYSLDAENWCINETRPHRDYMSLCFPLKGKEHDWGMHGVEWWSRQKERDGKPEYDIDDTPSMQGSCYFMTKDWFDNHLHGLSEVGYGQFSQEAQEVGNKTWLLGGAVKINKKTYYAHLHKGKTYGKMYNISGFNDETVRSSNWSAKHWMNDEEPGMFKKFEWLINEKFPGMPGWEPNWKEIWAQQLAEGWPA